MMFIVISILAAILAGSGIGGGSLYILLITTFNLLEYRTTMVYNLVMFAVVGITATITNIKSKKFDKKIFFKVIIFCLIGSYIGVYFSSIMDEQSLKKYFLIFILLIGIYEIISSLISFKKGKL